MKLARQTLRTHYSECVAALYAEEEERRVALASGEVAAAMAEVLGKVHAHR